MTTLRFLDTDDQAAFDRDGYVVRRVFQPAAAARLLEEFNQRHSDAELRPNNQANYYSSLDPNADRHKSMLEWTRQAWSTPLRKIATGWQQIESGVLIKPAHGGPTGLHQHAPATDKPFSASIVGWCALADCDEAHGCLFVVPGSHRLFRQIAAIRSGGYLSRPGIRDRLETEHARSIPLKAGEAVFFDNSLLHGAFPNEANAHRIAIGTLIANRTETPATYLKADGEIRVYPLRDNSYANLHARLTLPTFEADEVLRRFPDWSLSPNYAQIDALLRLRGPRATEDYDPLESVKGLAEPESVYLPPAGSVRQAVKRIPGAVRAYRLLKSLGIGGAGQ